MNEIPVFDPTAPSTDVAPVAEAIPAFDVNAPAQDVAPAEVIPPFNPSSSSEGQYTLADIKAATPQSLADDKDFAPIRFSVANEKELQNDPEAQNKVAEAYALKERKGSTLLQKGGKAVTGFLPALQRLYTGVSGAVQTPQDLFLRQGKAILKGKGTEEAGKIAGEIAAIPASIESNIASYLDLGKGFVRAGAETAKGVARAVMGAGSIPEAVSSLGKSELTPEEFRARYFSDLGSAKAATEAAKGQGPALEALGADTKNLADLGIIVDPEKIQELSIVTDPINFVPFGAAVGVVGKFGKSIIATTLSAEQAAKLAVSLNAAKDVAATTGGAGLTSIGRTAEQAGAATAQNLRKIGGGFGAIGLGHFLGQGIYTSLAVAKGIPKAVEIAGKLTKRVGKAISGKEPLSAPAAFAAEALGQGIRGTTEGAVITAPFVIGSRTEDEEGLLGMIPIAGLARAGHVVAPAATRAAGEGLQNKLASEIFKTVEQTPAPATPNYGTAPELDVTHAESITKLAPQSQNLVNLLRSKFEGSPVEWYSVDTKTMEHRTGNENAAGFAIESGEKTNPDGTKSPIFRVLLNESANAAPHEAYHAFEFLEPTRARTFEKSVADNLTPQQLRNFGDTYDAALNLGKPEASWNRLTDQGIAREVAAEAFSRIILGQDLSGVPPSVRKQASLFASGLLEKLGAPLAKLGAAKEVGGSLIGGVRSGTSSVKLGQEWINGLFDRLEKQGELVPTKPVVPAAPAVPPVKPVQLQLPLSERVPAVQPEPITAPVAPVAPVLPVSTPEPSVIAPEAQRATVIGAPEALAAAVKLGPEVTARVNELVGHIESGKPVLEIEHSGVKSEGTPEAPLGRTARRAEQEAPDFVREVYEKGLVPDRLVVVGGKPQLLAMSLDKVLANINRAVKDAAIYKVENLIPYESKEGKLTDAGWREATADLTTYTKNQANGFQGGGEPLVRPATDVGLSIPAETPGYVPTPLSKERADFQNLIQGLATPLTTREVKGQIPGNVKGQILAEANLRKLETPAAIRPENITKQEFKSQPGRSLKEVNPLRNKLAEAGVPVRELEDVTERINVQNILSMEPRPDVQFNAPVTDIIRGGFSPKPNESTADFGQRILQMDDATFASTMNASKGGLTGLAYDTGLALKDKADLTVLKGLADNANAAAQAAMANKDFAGAMPLVMRGQFFREALEAATNTGSAATMLPRLRPGTKPPFPRTEPEKGDFSPKPNIAVEDVAKSYLKGKRRPIREWEKQDYAKVDPTVAKKIADFYDEATSDPTDPAVQKSYSALARETLAQYEKMAEAGYTIEPWTGEGEPYASSDAMRTDVAENKHLYFLPTEGNIAAAAENPMLLPSGIEGLPVNDVFRAVHDFFGHAMRGYEFGPRGELNAWKSHSEMYGPEAQGALAAETLAQNSWVNFGKHIREAQEIPAAKDRPFAPQKNIVVPNELINEARAQFVERPAGTENLSPIKEAAIRTPGGEIFTGAWHGEAAIKLADAIGKGELKEPISKEARIEAEFMGEDTGFGEDGFVTQSGEFLNREQAFERAREIKQIRESFPGVSLEAGAFENRRAFAPKPKKPVEKDAAYYEKYAVKENSVPPTFTGWILPNGEFTNLKGSTLHETFLAENAEEINKKFGTNLSKTPDVEERLKALNKGFVRMREDNSGQLHIELNEKYWIPKIKRAVENQLLNNADVLGTVQLSLLNSKGNVVDSNVLRLHNLPEGVTPESAIVDGLRELRGGSAAPFPLAKDQAEVRGRLRQLVNEGKVTREFWLNSKNGEIVLAPDGHEIAAMHLIGDAFPKQPVDEMYKQGFVRGVRFGNGDIHLNSGGPGAPDATLSASAKRTMATISDSYSEAPVFLDSENTGIGAIAPGMFSPSEESLPGLKLPSEEQGAQIMAKRKIKKARDKFPEAIVPTFQKSGEGDFLMGDDGKPKPVAIEYELSDTPVGREAMKGIRGETERRDAVASALATGIEKTYKQAIKNPEIKAGEKWYSTAHARLKKIFGEDSKFFSELLGATSARTPVDTNYGFALDAYNKFRSGEYDDLIKTYRDGKQKWDSLDLADYVADTKNENPTRGQFIDWWVEKNDLLPRQSNGRKFGMNSRAVLRVLDGSWREEVQGPKTPNFAGNLSGDTFEATIDVWAARLLHRLANTGNDKRWRILPENETGVTDADFELGQSAFRKAADKLGIKPDALQAILWFGEKNHWEKNGWTRGAGAKKSDFNALLSETETAPTGIKKLKTAQVELGL